MRAEKRLIEKYKPRVKTDLIDIVILLGFMLWGANMICWANQWTNEPIEFKQFVAEYYERDVTAYNVGIKAQTDNTPCIGASNKDLCQAIEQGKKICAANFVPLGTKLNIEGFGTCEVADRMARRYTQRVDIAFGADQIQEAKEWGVKQLLVGVIK